MNKSFPNVALATLCVALLAPLPSLAQNVAIVNAGFRMAQGGPCVDTAPPRLDEHHAEILAWLDSEG